MPKSKPKTSPAPDPANSAAPTVVPAPRAPAARPLVGGGDLFIIDNSDEQWKAVRYLREWCDIARSIDIASGYVEIGALLALDDQWQKLDQMRILMGDEVSRRTGQAFRALADAGAQLVGLHLLEDDYPAAWPGSRSPLRRPLATFAGAGDDIVAAGYPVYEDGVVWINDTQGFQGVPEAVWAFHIGGYQVCRKWLKDRRGRALSADDKAHYCRVVTALNETLRLMAAIDAVIPAWPIV